MQADRIAILWPTEKNYRAFRSACADIRSPSLEQYRRAVSRDLDAKEAEGVIVERIEFDVEELIAFARRRGTPRIVAQVRAAFAAQLSMQRDLAERDGE